MSNEKKPSKRDKTLSDFNSRYLKYTPFLKRHSDFYNIFYDSDFVEVRRLVKELSDVLKVMTLRFDRHDTLQIARSVFDYVSQKEMYHVYPHMYYDCRFGDWRICIGCNREHNKHVYFVSVSGTTVDPRFNSWISDYGYGSFETIEEAITLFSEIVHDKLSTSLGSLF